MPQIIIGDTAYGQKCPFSPHLRRQDQCCAWPAEQVARGVGRARWCVEAIRHPDRERQSAAYSLSG